MDKGRSSHGGKSIVDDEAAGNPYRQLASRTRSEIFHAGKRQYDQSTFESCFLGELGQLLNREAAMNVLQSSSAEHRTSEKLRFRRRKYVTITEHFCSEKCRQIADTAAFKGCSIALILLQTVLVGVQVDDASFLADLDSAIVIAFCTECLFVGLGYGKEWWRYFTGLRIGKWEAEAKWNTFDFVVSFCSLGFMIFVDNGNGAVALVRLLRVVRVLKQLINNATGFIVIMEGLKSGLDSVFYICCLLAFTLFLFGVIGVGLFSANDPVGFGTIASAMLTLFQCATLSGWQRAYYLQVYGCDKYDLGGLYQPKDVLGSTATQFGWFFDYDCVAPLEQPFAAVVYFMVFTAFASFVVLSLFVGTITLGMIEAMGLLSEIEETTEAHAIHRSRCTHTWITEDERVPASRRRKNPYLYDDTTTDIEEERARRAAKGSFTMADGPEVGMEPPPATLTPDGKDFANPDAPTSTGAMIGLSSNGLALDAAYMKRMARAIVLSPEVLKAITGDETLGRTLKNIGLQASSFRDSSGANPSNSDPAQEALLQPNNSENMEGGELKAEEDDLQEEKVEPKRHGSAFMDPSVLGASAAMATALGLDGLLEEDSNSIAQRLSCFLALPYIWQERYLNTAKRAKRIVSHKLFEGLMMSAVLLSAVLIGIETYYNTQYLTEQPTDDIGSNNASTDGGTDGDGDESFATARTLLLARVQNVVIVVFAGEVVIKLLAEGFTPQRYFASPWNCFDFTVTAVAVVALLGVLGFNASLFRLFRLLQLLRTFSKVEKLRVIIESLSRALNPMKYIFVLVMVFSYLTAIAGVLLFRENDPFHFGFLNRASLSIYRIETLTGWEKVMYINVFGCAKYPIQYSIQNEPSCPNPHAYGWIAVVFFCVVVLIGGILLPTLMVALITACTDAATSAVRTELETLKAMREETAKHPDFYTASRVKLMAELFKYVDTDGSGALSFSEVYPLMAVVDDVFLRKPEVASHLFLVVDVDSSGYVEIDEFMHLFRNVNQVIAKVKSKTLAAKERVARAVERNLSKGAGDPSLNAQKPTLASFVDVVDQVQEVKRTASDAAAGGRNRHRRRFSAKKNLATMGAVLANSDLPEELRDFAAEGGTFGTAEVGDPPLEVDVMVALMLADPRHIARVLHHSRDPHKNYEDSSAVYALFGDASESLHTPLLLHRGATLEANIAAAATVLGRLRELATQDIGHIIFQKGLSLKVDGFRWKHGQLLSPATVLASAKAAKAALDRVATTEATLNYLAEDAYATGYGIVTSRDYALASAADNARLAFAKEDEGGAAAADRFSLALKSGNGEPLEPWTRAPDDSSLMDTMSQDQVERVNQILAECDKHHGTASVQGLVTAAQLRQQLAKQGVRVSPAARMWWTQNTDPPPSVAHIEAQAPPTPFTDRLLAQARGLDPPPLPPLLQWPHLDEKLSPPRTFAHDGLLVFASRPGWSVLAGPQAARSQRQRELKEFGVAARRKVARSLVDSAAMTVETASSSTSMMKGGNKTSSSSNAGASASANSSSTNKALHQEISQARRIFTALMLDADVSTAQKGGGKSGGGFGKQQKPQKPQPQQVSSQRVLADASRTNDDEDMVVDRETFAHNLRRLLQKAQAKRMAQETMAESDRLRRLVANASSEAEKKAAQEEAAASELAMLERDVKSLESPEEGLSAAEFEAVLSALDGDNDGRISLKEFESFVNNADDLMHAILEVTSAFAQTPYDMPDLRSAFATFDKDGSLALEPSEFQAAVQSLGCDLTPLEVARVLAVVDSDHNGYVTYEEFEAAFVNVPSVKQQLRAALEHLAVHGPDGSDHWTPGSGARAFHSAMNALPPVHDPTGALEHLASNRRGKVEAARARRAKSAAAKLQQSNGTGGGADDTTSASVAPASETTTPSSTSSRDSAAHVDTSDLDDLMLEEENASVGDFHVNWEDLESMLLALPLGLTIPVVRKILLITDATGGGHCSLRKFETLALNLEAPLSRLRNAFRARCASNLALAVHPLPEMLASAWHPDQGGNVPHHELVDNPGLLEALLPPPPFQPSSSSSSPPSQAGIGASVSGGSKDRKDKKDDDKWRPLLTTSEATRLLYALDPQGVGRISLPLLASLVTDVSDITAKIATARVLRHYRSSVDNYEDNTTVQSARVAAQLAEESADSFERMNLPRSSNSIQGGPPAATSVDSRHPFEAATAGASGAPAAAVDGSIEEASPLEVDAYGMFWTAMEQAGISSDQPSNSTSDHDSTSKNSNNSASSSFELRKAGHLDLRRASTTTVSSHPRDGVGDAAIGGVIGAAAHDAAAHAVEVAEASFEVGSDQALALWHATSGASSDALLVKATLNRLKRQHDDYEVKASKKREEDEKTGKKNDPPPRRKSSHSATTAAAAAAAREEVTAKKRLSKSRASFKSGSEGGDERGLSGDGTSRTTATTAAGAAAAAEHQQQYHKPSTWKRAEDDEGFEDKPMSEKRAELVTRLLNECEKHASTSNAQRAVTVKQDLKKHVKMSDSAKLWWTQDHQVPASVLHAETLAAGLRVVPVMVPMVPGDGKEEGKQPATYPAGARKKDEEEAFQHHRVVEDLYREGWKDHESAEHATASKDWVTSSVHLAPALDFLLTCFRGQARTFREEVITPEMRSFAEARLETSALLHAARSGSALKLPPPKRQLMDPMPQPSSSSEVPLAQPSMVGKNSAAAQIFGASDHRSSSSGVNLGRGGEGIDTSDTVNITRNNAMSDWTNCSVDAVHFIFEPVQDLEPPPPLRLSPLEMARLAVHCSDGADNVAGASALRRRSSLLSSHPPHCDSPASSSPFAAGAASKTTALHSRNEVSSHPAQSPPSMSAPRLAQWCSQVNQVTRRLLNDVEKFRNSKESAVANELNDLDGFAADNFQGDQEVALAALRRESKIRRIRFSQLEKTRDEKRAEATRLGLEGSAFKRAGDTKGARRAYKQKLDVEEEDEHGKTYFMIGELWCQEDNWVAACLAFDNAIKWMPEFGDEFEVKNARMRMESEKRATEKRRSSEQHKRVSIFGRRTSMKTDQRGATPPPPERFSDKFITQLGSEGNANSSDLRKRGRKSSMPFLTRALSTFMGGNDLLSSSPGAILEAQGSADLGSFVGLGGDPSSTSAHVKPMGPAEKLRDALVTSRTVWEVEFGLSGPLGNEKRRRQNAVAAATAAAAAAAASVENNGNSSSSVAAAAAAEASTSSPVVVTRSDPPLLETAVVGGTVMLHGVKADPPGRVTFSVAEPAKKTPKAKRASKNAKKKKSGTASSPALSSSSSPAFGTTAFARGIEEMKELSLDDDDTNNKKDGGDDNNLDEESTEEEDDNTALEDEVAVLGICDGGRSAAKVSKASRYLGDQGTCVEFALNFAAYPQDSSHQHPRGSLAAAMAAYADSSPTTSNDLTTVYFRGFIDTGLPKVMEGYAYMPANETLAAKARKAASANSHYEQAFVLSNLGDATFDLQAFSLGASSNTGLRGLNQSTFSTGRLEASHVVSVTLLEGQNLVCKEAAHKVIFSGKATSDPYVVGTICGQSRVRSSTVMKTLNPVWPPATRSQAAQLKASQQESQTAAADQSSSSTLSASPKGEVLYDQVPLPPNFKDEPELLFTVWDQDERSEDDPMGEVKIPFSSLEVGHTYAQWWPITKSDGAYDATGALFLKVYIGPKINTTTSVSNEDKKRAGNNELGISSPHSSSSQHEKSTTSPTSSSGFDPSRMFGGSREGSARSSGSKGNLLSPSGLMSSVGMTRKRRSKGFGNSNNTANSSSVNQQRPASKSVAIPPVEVFMEKGSDGEGGRAMVKLGKFLAVRADYAFHADDRHGVFRTMLKRSDTFRHTGGGSQGATPIPSGSMDSNYSRRDSEGTDGDHDGTGNKSGSSPPMPPHPSSYPSPIREEASPPPSSSKKKKTIKGGVALEAAVEAAAEARERTRAAALIRYLNRLSADPSEITTLLAQLPPDLASFMQSHEFNEGCRDKFKELLQPGEDTLSSSAMLPILTTMSAGQGVKSLTEALCAQFMSVFDVDGDGRLNLIEFTALNRFFFLVACLDEEEHNRDDVSVGTGQASDEGAINTGSGVPSAASRDNGVAFGGGWEETGHFGSTSSHAPSTSPLLPYASSSSTSLNNENHHDNNDMNPAKKKVPMSAEEAQLAIAAAAAHLAVESPPAGVLASLDAVLSTAYSGHGFEFEESFGKEPSVHPPNVHDVATMSRGNDAQQRSTTRMTMRHNNNSQQQPPQLQKPSRLQSAARGIGTGRYSRLNGPPSTTAPPSGGSGISSGSRLSVAANAGNRASNFSNAPTRGGVGKGGGAGKGVGGRGTAAAVRGGGGRFGQGGNHAHLTAAARNPQPTSARSSSSSRPVVTGPPQLRPKQQQQQQRSKSASRGGGAWFPVLDQATGRTYYVHAETNQARWNPPPPPP